MEIEVGTLCRVVDPYSPMRGQLCTVAGHELADCFDLKGNPVGTMRVYDVDPQEDWGDSPDGLPWAMPEGSITPLEHCETGTFPILGAEPIPARN
jgi:hypothetical protein